MSQLKKTNNIVLCALFAALIAIGAFIKIPVPICPFTMQVFFSTMGGLFLGKRLGAASVIAYMVTGLIGIPVFTNGGGIQYLAQPTFGYIIGFALGAFVTGMIAHKDNTPTFPRLLAASFVGLAIIYICGMTYYYIIGNYIISSPIGVWPLFLYCFLMVIPGDIVLCVLASFLAKRLIPQIKKYVS